MDVGTSPPPPVGFFTIADATYFLGLVALVNSLRLQGHADPITVLDLALHADQREALNNECEFVTPPPMSSRHPWLMEPTACMVRKADTVVYLDADIIVTSPLDEIIQAAREGQICVFADGQRTRWFAEWERIFDLLLRPGFRGAFSYWWLTQGRRPWRGGKRLARQVVARLSGNRGGPGSPR